MVACDAQGKIPDSYLFEPWLLPQSLQAQLGVRVGVDIPLPIVDLAMATKEAKTRLHQRRQQPEVKLAKPAIVEKHGSRKVIRRPRASAPGHAATRAQLGFDF